MCVMFWRSVKLKPWKLTRLAKCRDENSSTNASVFESTSYWHRSLLEGNWTALWVKRQPLNQRFSEHYSFLEYNRVLQGPQERIVQAMCIPSSFPRVAWITVPPLSQTKHRRQLGDIIIFTLKVNTSIVLNWQIPSCEKNPSCVWPTLISVLVFNENIPNHFQISVMAVYTVQVHARGFDG